jgi:hypothetical protein
VLKTYFELTEMYPDTCNIWICFKRRAVASAEVCVVLFLPLIKLAFPTSHLSVQQAIWAIFERAGTEIPQSVDGVESGLGDEI